VSNVSCLFENINLISQLFFNNFQTVKLSGGGWA